MKESRLNFSRALCSLLMILMPWLLLGVLSLALQKNAFAANPVWADEINYFRSLKALCESGVPHAANGFFEGIAKIGCFGSGGLVPAMLYGLMGKLFGVASYSIPLMNAAWISIAALVFVLLRKPCCRLSLAIAGSYLAFVPVILYAATSMTELFSYALMLLYLAFFLTYHEKHCALMLVLSVVTCMAASVYRPYYGWMIVPVALSLGQFHFSKKNILRMILLCMLCFACCIAGQLFISENYQSFLYRLFHADSLLMALRMLLSHFKSNLLDIFTRGECSVPEILLLAGYAVMMLSTLIVGLRRGLHRDLIGIALLMLAVALTILLLFDVRDWRGYRMLAPILWLAIVYCFSRGHYMATLAAVAVSLLSLVWLLMNPATGSLGDENRFSAVNRDEALSEAVAAIEYDSSAQDIFDNTVRTDFYSLQLSCELDSRLGVQYGWLSTDTVEKSRWLLTDRLRCVVTGYECVADFGSCKLYRRLTVEEELHAEP